MPAAFNLAYNKQGFAFNVVQGFKIQGAWHSRSAMIKSSVMQFVLIKKINSPFPKIILFR